MALVTNSPKANVVMSLHLDIKAGNRDADSRLHADVGDARSRFVRDRKDRDIGADLGDVHSRFMNDMNQAFKTGSEREQKEIRDVWGRQEYLQRTISQLTARGETNDFRWNPPSGSYGNSAADLKAYYGQMSDYLKEKQKTADPQTKALINQYFSQLDDYVKEVSDFEATGALTKLQQAWGDYSDPRKSGPANQAVVPYRNAYAPARFASPLSNQGWPGSDCNCDGQQGWFSSQMLRDLVNQIISGVLGIFGMLGRLGIPLPGCQNSGVNSFSANLKF